MQNLLPLESYFLGPASFSYTCKICQFDIRTILFIFIETENYCQLLTL